MSFKHHKDKSRGFSLLELLIVIAVIAILSTLLLPQIISMKEGSEESVARQQQVELQTALGNWLVARSSENGGLAAARTDYSETSVKLSLLQDYLQPSTYNSLSPNGDKVTSAALDGANAYLQFSSWSVGGQQPTVNWISTK